MILFREGVLKMSIMIFVDQDIQLNFSMPKSLKILIEECDEFARNNDWYFYMVRRDEIESTGKAALQNGTITEQQFDLILKKYGVR